jgi:hypothetical protein
MNVRRLTLCAMLICCLALAGPAWAGSIEFGGFDVNGQGTLNFDPGMTGNTLTIGAGGGGNGALITTLLDTLGLCGGSGCGVTGGYMTLTSGGYLGGGTCNGGNCSYNFGSGGTIDVFGSVTTSLGTSVGHLFSATFANGSFGVGGSTGTYSGGLKLPSITLFGPAFGSYTFTGGSGDAIVLSLNTGTCDVGGACTGLVDEASVSLQTIPEPATLSVLGAGLLAFGTGLRRKLRRG